MNNAERIKALRICANQTCCDNCPRYDIDHDQDAQRCCIELINDAADALEAAEKRIAELSLDCELFQQKCMELHTQLPKEGEWIDEQRGRWIYAKCNLCGKVQDVRSNHFPELRREDERRTGMREKIEVYVMRFFVWYGIGSFIGTIGVIIHEVLRRCL